MTRDRIATKRRIESEYSREVRTVDAETDVVGQMTIAFCDLQDPCTADPDAEFCGGRVG